MTTTPTDIYIPPNSITLDKATYQQQIRLGIQGFPKTGKTWSALTFPNPVVLDIDRGLGAHHGRADVIQVPVWDVEQIGKKYYPSEPDNLKHVVDAWLAKEGPKLTSNQTLIIDALTGIQSAYHRDWSLHPVISSRSNKVDDRAEWGLKIPYFTDLMDRTVKFKCNVILISHEAEKKDASGEYSGKIRPLLSGQFGDQITSRFTDWFRQLSGNKPNPASLTDVQKRNIERDWKMTPEQFVKECEVYPRNTIYYWQLESDDTFDGGASSLVNFPRFIFANYASFCKYRKTIPA